MTIVTGQTAEASDFINKSERNATKSNDAGRVAKLESDGYQSSEFVRFGFDVDTFFPIDGSSTPQACFIDTDGTLLLGKADVTARSKFNGFAVADYSGQTPAAFLNSNTYTSSGGSFTLNAGTDRALYITIELTVSSGSPTMPTAVSWNGNSLTKVAEEVNGTSGVAIWRYIAGSSGSGSAGTVTYSGQSGTNLLQYVYVDAYQYVHQSTPEDVFDTSTDSGGSSITDNVTPTQSYALAIHAVVNRSGNAITIDSKLSERHATSVSAKFADGYLTVAEAKTISDSYSSAGNDTNSITIVLNNSTTTEVSLLFLNVLDGFSGLTPGVKYYLSNTAGAISTTPGTNTVLVGKALSATELQIIHD